MNPLVSVVVPYYRAQADLDRLVAALARQTHPSARLELVVCDDGSLEPPRLPRDLPFRSRVARQDDLGFRASAARALGAGLAEGEVLCFLDGDMVPERSYVAASVSGLQDADVVVGRRRHVDPAHLTAAWLPGDAPQDWAELEDPAWLREGYSSTGDLARADSTSYRYVISAVLSVRREAYEDAGGFDPSFVGYGGEDWELAHRLWRVGARFRHLPDAIAWHLGADLAGREDPRRARRIKNHEALVLAPRISAATARGVTLHPGPDAAPRVRVLVHPPAEDDAATVVTVDALLQAFPSADVRILAPSLDPEVHAVLADPRIRVTPERPDADPDADWTLEVLRPLRPSGASQRPDPRVVADLLLRAEQEDVDRVRLMDGGAPVCLLTCVRAAWAGRRDRSLRESDVSLSDVGWRVVEHDPDLEAWWGGWS